MKTMNLWTGSSFKLGVLLLAATVSSFAQTRIYETNVYVETIAGSGFYGYLDGQGTQTMFHDPKVLVVDSATNVYVWDSANCRIRKFAPDGMVTTFAGSGEYSSKDGQGTNASFYDVTSMTIGPDGIIWLSDIWSSKYYAIRTITPAGSVKTLRSWSPGYQEGPLTTAKFLGLIYLTADHQGNILVSDDTRIRKVDTNPT
jgi:hypothetical protein